MKPPTCFFPLTVATLLALSACSSDLTTNPILERRSPEVEAVTKTSISGIVGAVASPAPVIRVTDGNTHKPLANVIVEFRVIAGGGSVANGSVATDAMGLASPGEWTFMTRPGVCSVGVYLNGRLTVLFAATLSADVPARIDPLTPTDQAALAGYSVDGPAVVVRDRFNNPVPKAAVSFAVTDGDGMLGTKSQATSDDGFARSGSWNLSTTPGHNRAVASVAGLDAVVFNAESLDPATIKWYELDSVRVGLQSLPPSNWNVTSAKLGITAFDPCLCKKQDGYFIDEVLYSDSGEQIFKTSGRYHMDEHLLTISSLSNPGAIHEGELLLDRPDPDFGIPLTWVYKEIRL